MDQFFRFCAEGDEVSVSDLLLTRYSTIPDLPYDVFIELIQKAKEENKRDELFRAWVNILPLMQMKMIDYVSFGDYYDKCTGKNIDFRPASEILKEVEEIRKELKDGYI